MRAKQNTDQVNMWTEPRSAAEVEDIIVFVRLELYNRGLPCGPKALRRRLQDHYNIHPLPSERTIATILKRQGLTGARTGHYEGE